MTGAVILALRLTTSWSLPALLADAQVVFADSVLTTIHRTDWIFAYIHTNRSWSFAPASCAKALAHDTHSMSTAIWSSSLCIKICAMFLLAVLTVPFASALTSTNGGIPASLRWVAAGVQLRTNFYLGLWHLFQNLLLYNFATFFHDFLNNFHHCASRGNRRWWRRLVWILLHRLLVWAEDAIL